MPPSEVTILDATMTLLFHDRHHWRGASEFNHFYETSSPPSFAINSGLTSRIPDNISSTFHDKFVALPNEAGGASVHRAFRFL